jgi:CubicO group peptidase (beta-lactamase class C family)
MTIQKDGRRKARLESAILPEIEAGRLAGAAAMVGRDGEVVEITALGRRDLIAGLPVERDTLFRIASLTKPVTTVAALTLLDEGRFELDEPITRCAPEFARMRVLRNLEGPLDETREASRPISFRDLLTHRSGLTYGDFHRGPIARAHADTLGPQIDNSLAPDEWIARLAALPLVDQPGANFHYGLSTDLLGFLLTRLEGVSLGEVLHRRVFAPLGMRDTAFVLTPEQLGRRAGLCGFDVDGQLTTLTVAPGGHALEERPQGMTFESGGQGLWSSLDDYLAFASALVDERAHVLRPDTRALMTSNQLTPEQRAAARMLGQPIFASGHGYGLGVAVVLEPPHADPLRCRGGVGTIGWPGAYGSWWQADPNDRSVLIFLSHSMVDLGQLMRGFGLGVWNAIARLHEVATTGAIAEH